MFTGFSYSTIFLVELIDAGRYSIGKNFLTTVVMVVGFKFSKFVRPLPRFKACRYATSIQTKLPFKAIWFSFPFQFAANFVKSCSPARLSSRRDYKSTRFQICCSSAQIQSHFTST